MHRYRRDDSKSQSKFESNFEFISKIVKFDQKSVFFNQIWPFSIKFNYFWYKFDYFWLNLIDLNQLKDWNRNPCFGFQRFNRLDVVRRSKSTALESESSSIRFGDPNRISLVKCQFRHLKCQIYLWNWPQKFSTISE